MGGLCLGVPGRPRRQLAAGCVVDSFEPPVGAGGDAEGCADSSVCFRRTTLRFWLGAHGPQARIGASFDENRHCYRRSPRHLRRHLQAAQTNRQRNPQRRQRNPPVRGETNGAAGRRIAELERPKAKQRQQEGGDHGRQARYSGLGPMGPKPEYRAWRPPATATTWGRSSRGFRTLLRGTRPGPTGKRPRGVRRPRWPPSSEQWAWWTPPAGF
ncbi:phiRv1 phage protein [Mycobacterium tuberculosis]|nr:phiRv1 phage protein [Mycobacterium tuberculosis]